MFEVHNVSTRSHYIPNKLHSVALNLFFAVLSDSKRTDTENTN